MVKGIIAERVGGPEVFSIQDIDVGVPKGKEVLVKHEAIGLNFIDINYRRGTYDLHFPAILGCEAAGHVEAIGDDVKDFYVGDRVAYATVPSGAYCEKRIVHQKYLVPIPPFIDFDAAAAMLLKGMTAHYLLRRTFFVASRNTILVYAAAGGVGQILCKLAQHYGAKVIAVVGSQEKVKKVQDLGVSVVINAEKEDIVDVVKKHTNNQGVHVAYDSIGKDTFDASLKALSDFGLMVSFGSASGAIPPFDISRLKERGLFLTAPVLFTYKKNREELLLGSNEVFALMKQKVIAPDYYKKYDFSQIQEAHSDIENRKTTGQSILKPNI